MDPVTAHVMPTVPALFHDGLGDRVLLRNAASGEIEEVLRLRPELTGVPAFEFALSEQVRRLAAFEHAAFGRTRRVDHVAERLPVLGLVSDHTPGSRLSDILAAIERKRLTLDVNAALCLVRQIAGAVVALHKDARGVSHGALAPERIVITAAAKPVIVEHVLGPALEQLRFTHERYWKELRVAVPPSAGSARLDQRADVAQVGMIALALILGRPLQDEEHLRNIGDVLASAAQITTRGDREPLVAMLRSWLARALQVDLRRSFATAVEAQQTLDQVLAEGNFTASPADLDAFMSRHRRDSVIAGPVVPPVPPDPWASPTSRAPRPATANEKEDPWVAPDVDPEAIEERLRASGPVVYAPPAPRGGGNWRRLAVVGSMLMAFAGGGLVVARMYESERLSLLRFYEFGYAWPAFKLSGTLVVESSPKGAQVIVDGESRGMTPLKLTLKSGPHVLELRGGGESRVIPLTVSAGAEVAQYIELGEMSVKGRPAGRAERASRREATDGKPSETATPTLDDLTPGVTTSGWIGISAPFEVQLYEDGQLLGTSKSGRIYAVAGPHQIEIVNQTLGYREVRTVQVAAGRVTPVVIKLPKAPTESKAEPSPDRPIDGGKTVEPPQ